MWGAGSALGGRNSLQTRGSVATPQKQDRKSCPAGGSPGRCEGAQSGSPGAGPPASGVGAEASQTRRTPTFPAAPLTVTRSGQRPGAHGPAVADVHVACARVERPSAVKRGGNSDTGRTGWT